MNIRKLGQYWGKQYKQLFLSFRTTLLDIPQNGNPRKFSWAKVYTIVYRPKSILIIAIAFLLLIFKETQTRLIEHLWVSPIMSNVPTGWNIDTILISVFILVAIWLFRKGWIQYKPSFAQKILACYVLLLYVYYRNSGLWSFHSSVFSVSLYHADLIWALLFFPLGRIVRFHFIQSRKESVERFIEDIPIDGSAEIIPGEIMDLSIRKRFAVDLAQKLGEQSFKQSFAVAIIGPWGNGKTSFLNHVQNELSNSKNRLQIQFNPFSNFDEKAIIIQFFSAVSSAILPYDGRLSTRIMNYAALLVKLIGEDKSTAVLATAIGHFVPTVANDAKQDLEEIRESLNALNKQLIIYIDDVDRLSQKEILQVLMLIRNTANLPNTIYIVPCDKNYVMNALQGRAEFSGLNFLEKFFQLEFILPAYDPILIRKYFYSKVEAVILRNAGMSGADEKEGLKSLSNYLLSEATDAFDIHVSNYRDAIRLANNFCFSYEQIRGEVDLNDFLILELIKLNYTAVHNHFVLAYERFLEESNSNGNSTDVLYELRESELSSITNHQTEEQLTEYVIIQEIVSRHTIMGIQLSDVPKIKQLFVFLFNPSKKVTDLSIRRKDNIEQYFSLRLLAGGIAHREFVEVIKKSGQLSEIEFPTNWLLDGVDIQVLNKSRLYQLESKDELLRTVDLAMILGRKGTSQLVSGQAIKSIIQIPVQQLKAKGIISSGREVWEYIMTNYCDINKAVTPYGFESDLLATALANSLPIEWPEFDKVIEGLILNYLKKHLEQIRKIDNYVYYLFWNSIKHNKKETQAVFYEFIEKSDPEGFLYSILRAEPFEQAYKLDENVKVIFNGGLSEFESFLTTISDTPVLNEFKQFFALLKLDNYQWHLVYNFQHLSPLVPLMVSDTSTSKTELFVRIEDSGLYDQLSEQRSSLLWNQSNENIDFIFNLSNAADQQILFIRHTGVQKISDVISLVDRIIIKGLRTISKNGFESRKIESKNYYVETPWIMAGSKSAVTILSLQTTHPIG